jgi:site-specific DNA-cytosine methylase
MKYAIDLFSGSKNVTHALENLGYTVFSCDWNENLHPTICCNILDFPFELINVPISVLWASPDCATFSRQAPADQWQKKILKYRQYHYSALTEKSTAALLYIQKTIDIINYFNPKVYFIENPVGRLRHIPAIKNFVPYRYSVNYKDYGFDYSKETDIYTNQLFSLNTKKQIRPGKSVNSLTTSFERSKVPAQLINFLIKNSQL